MKKILATIAVSSAAFGVLLAGAGTASAQDPHSKYPTKTLCQTYGFQYVKSGQAFRYECSGPHANSPASQKYWLLLDLSTPDPG